MLTELAVVIGLVVVAIFTFIFSYRNAANVPQQSKESLFDELPGPVREIQEKGGIEDKHWVYPTEPKSLDETALNVKIGDKWAVIVNPYIQEHHSDAQQFYNLLKSIEPHVLRITKKKEFKLRHEDPKFPRELTIGNAPLIIGLILKGKGYLKVIT